MTIVFTTAARRRRRTPAVWAIGRV